MKINDKIGDKCYVKSVSKFGTITGIEVINLQDHGLLSVIKYKVNIIFPFDEVEKNSHEWHERGNLITKSNYEFHE